MVGPMGGPMGGFGAGMDTGLNPSGPGFAGPGQPPSNQYDKPKDEGPVEFKDLFATGMEKISDRKEDKESSID